MKHDVNQVAERLASVEPATAVVSLINSEDISSVRSFFCNQVHFLTSPEEGASWLENHPGDPRRRGLPARLDHGRTNARPGSGTQHRAADQRDTTLQLRTPRPARKTGLIHGL
ncbi:hypothetical protein HD598_000848 [Neomicrococcus aestuarii]|uniref:Uncharacterized protein n=1 Tax=Neomicrococcus aestuarii TaxID=556325 RepID=A0A7W8TV99_9MICC|nr:organomercurial lyase [Neomicrococcus aestuarii]MBB5512161.1 hypothetical protein [Neomicrococcus aestuarii]